MRFNITPACCAFLGFLVGCGGSTANNADVGQPVPQKTVLEEPAEGPHKVEFDAGGNFSHHFELPVLKSFGTIKYIIASPTKLNMQITTLKSAVVGCDESKARIQVTWEPNSENVREWVLVKEGDIVA